MSLVKPGCTFLPNVTICWPGGAFERGTWECPACGKDNARRVTEWPNYFMLTPGYTRCECGDSWWEDEPRKRPDDARWREKSQDTFEREWEQAAPEGSRFDYSNDGYLVVTTPDGNRHSARDGGQCQPQ